MAATSLEVAAHTRSTERRLYTGAAIVALLVVFAGFARTYYLKGWFGTPELGTLKQAHGLLMTSWFALFLFQARLAATSRMQLHRRTGYAGVVLAVCLMIVGLELGIASARAGHTPLPSIPPLVFLVMPVGELVVFAALFSAAVLLRRRGAYHKRLMLLASLAMLTPAVARLPFDFVSRGGPLVFFALTDLVIVAAIAVDTLRNRRLHPVFIAGFIVVVVGQFGRLAFSQTAAWNAIAHWLVS